MFINSNWTSCSVNMVYIISLLYNSFCYITFQVFDLGDEAPDSVLRRLYLNIERLKGNGDHFAAEIEERMKIIVSRIL